MLCTRNDPENSSAEFGYVAKPVELFESTGDVITYSGNCVALNLDRLSLAIRLCPHIPTLSISERRFLQIFKYLVLVSERGNDIDHPHTITASPLTST